jgi:hypothetical protein
MPRKGLIDLDRTCGHFLDIQEAELAFHQWQSFFSSLKTERTARCSTPAATPSRAGSVVERLLPAHPVTQVNSIVSKLELCSDRHPIEGFSNLSQPARNLAEALIDHREFTRDLRVLDLSQSAASPGAVGRVLALGDDFEPEQATDHVTEARRLLKPLGHKRVTAAERKPDS